MSEIVVLDTHIWIWFINGDFDKFPESWRQRIESSARVGVSPVSCFEIALAQQQGKLLLPCSAQEWCQTALFPVGIDIFPLTPDIAFRAVHLSPIHRDPFDRIIMATALEYQAKLVSVDRMIILYPELLNCLLQ